MFAIEAGGVRFVNHEPGTAAILELDDLAERRDVAVHGEDGLGDDKDAGAIGEAAGGALFCGPLQDGLEVIEVIVAKDAEVRTGEAGGIHDASMDAFINDDDIVPAEEGGNGAKSGGIAAGEGERRGSSFVVGQSLLEPMVWGEGAADQPRGAGADAIVSDRADGCAADARVVGQTEIVVRGEIDQGTAADADVSGLWRSNLTQGTMESLSPDRVEIGSQVPLEISVNSAPHGLRVTGFAPS